ncbi:MAG: exo-alpha-sialidase [Verrucomicrobiota bacterium JB024]|nr:exo-alpha-sialidase [Verrucomicrobiota bacterium JB024]
MRHSEQEKTADSRNTAQGLRIPTLNYCDQPYVVKADDGAWVCVVTTGTGDEGDPGQIVTSLRSTDQGHTWESPVPLEPADGPEASYAVALKVPSGRIYAFYNHNTDRVREVLREDGGTYERVDSLGHYVFKYSDDHGKSWSPERHEIPIRAFACDKQNSYQGKLRFFWNVGRPMISRSGSVYLPHSKVGAMGAGFYAQSEGVFLRSDNILTESDPTRIEWTTLPDGDVGLRPPPDCGRVAEEHTVVELSDGTLYSVYRTIGGHPACAYSEDGGRSWTPPQCASYDPRDPAPRLFKHPRAANFVWKTQSGRYLYWFHNHGGHGPISMIDDWANSGAYSGRNPAWLCAGREVDSPDGSGKRIVWSEPEILLYDDDPAVRMSYPDLIEESGHFWITETQKTIARVHRIDDHLLDTLLNQHMLNSFIEDETLLAYMAEPPQSAPMPRLPELLQHHHLSSEFFSTSTHQGFTLDFIVDASNADTVLIDTMDSSGKGLRLALDSSHRLQLTLGDGRQTCLATSDPLTPASHSVSLIVDGGPHIVMFVVDGHLQDGGEDRQYGWSRFSPTLTHANGQPDAHFSPHLSELRIYARALLVSEAVGHACAHRQLV